MLTADNSKAKLLPVDISVFTIATLDRFFKLLTYRFFKTLSVVGWIQLVDQVVLPPSLQMEIENLPKLALTRFITVPSSHSISKVEPSQPYLVLLSEPET